MNMKITKQQLLKIVKNEIENEWYYGDEVYITNEDDLHDFLLSIQIGETTIEEYDYIYYQAINLIPQILNEVIDYIEDEKSYGMMIIQQKREYYSMII